MDKTFAIPSERIRPLVPPERGGTLGCFASDRITVDAQRVGFMYREAPEEEHDSGWRFFAGDESEADCADPQRFGLYQLNTLANYDPEIAGLLEAPVGSAFERRRPTAALTPCAPPE